MIRWIMSATLALGLGNMAPMAHADEATVLILRIQKDLRDMARDLRDLGKPGADEGDVDRLDGEIWDLVEPLIDLIYEMEDDHQGQRIIKGYPSSMDELRDALKIMAELKEQAPDIGSNDEERLCGTVWPRDLAAEMRKALAIPATDQEDLEIIAKGYAEDAEEFIDDARELLSELDELRDDVKGYRPDHRDFNALAVALFEAADDTYDDREEVYENIEDSCSKLVAWEKYQAFEDAVQILDDWGVAIVEFETDSEEWLKANGGMFESVCDSIRAMRDAYCRKDWEPENRTAMTSYDSLADKTAGDFRRIFASLIADYEQNLRDRGQSLAPRDRETEQLFTRVRNREAKLRRYLYGSDVLKGSNNPKLRLWQVYGIQQHERMTGQFNCNLAGKVIPGLSSRNLPDCVDIRRCLVIEFKPGTSQGLKDGGKISDYVFAINDWLESEWPDHAGTPVPSRQNPRNMRFDSAFVEQARAWECFDASGNAKFWGDVETYKPCDKDNDLRCEP